MAWHRCEQCGKKFAFQKSLIEHQVQANHSQTSAGRQSTTGQMQQAIRHPEVLRCKQCPYEAVGSTVDLELHIRLQHVNGTPHLNANGGRRIRNNNNNNNGYKCNKCRTKDSQSLELSVAFVIVVWARVRASFTMRWTLSLGTVAVAILLAIVACLLTPSDAVGAGGFSKRPRVNFRTWLKNVYPQIAEEDEIIQQIGGATGVGAQDKRNRDEDYGHLRFGRVALGDDYGHMRFGRK